MLISAVSGGEDGCADRPRTDQTRHGSKKKPDAPGKDIGLIVGTFAWGELCRSGRHGGLSDGGDNELTGKWFLGSRGDMPLAHGLIQRGSSAFPCPMYGLDAN